MRFNLGWKAASKGYNFVFHENFLMWDFKPTKILVVLEILDLFKGSLGQI